MSIARAVLDHEATGAPLPVPQAAVVCAAKRPLAAGDVLDGEGGATVYGLVDDARAAVRERLLPIGLSHGAKITRPVPEDGSCISRTSRSRRRARCTRSGRNSSRW